MSEDHYAYFSISPKEDGYQIHRRDRNSCLNSNQSYRKARIGALPYNDKRQIFIDPQFNIDLDQINEDNRKEPRYHLRRLYQIYDSPVDFNIFDQQWYQPTHYSNVNEQQDLPTILSEYIIIDKEEFQTRFFTKTINKLGYYQYFIRRNGQYHVQYMDDLIPVQGKKRLPIWGINIKQPWKLLLLKAWIKEKKSIKGVIDAKPYEFIDAFGLPGYRALSIKNQIVSLQHSKLPESLKQIKEKKIHFNEEGFITVGKTRNSDRVKELGLRKNRAGYKIIPQRQHSNINQSLLKSSIKNQEVIYKIQSELPVYWAGQYSIVGKKIKPLYKQQNYNLNMQKQFLITYQEMSEVFSKFYTAPTYHHKYGYDSVAQQSIFIEIEDYQNEHNPYYFFKIQISKDGNFNLNIDLPLKSAKDKHNDDRNLRYSSIKYFLAKLDQQIDLQTTLKDPHINRGFSFYDGQYVKGYHKSLNRFIHIKKGTYFAYVKLQNYQAKINHFSINLITNARVQTFERADLQLDQQSRIISKTLYQQAKNSLRGYLYSGSKDMIVYLSNKFDQFGFGTVAIFLHEKAKNYNLAMKVHLNKLAIANLSICKEACGLSGDLNLDQPMQFIAKPGQPAILILEKTRREKSHPEKFPPENTVDFFQIEL